MVAWLHLIHMQQQTGPRAARYRAQYDLMPVQVDVVERLSAAPGISLHMLVDRLLVTSGAVCGLLERVATPPQVECRSPPEDGRSHTHFFYTDGLTINYLRRGSTT